MNEDDDAKVGGIDINKAKELIKIQDKSDKKRERERIKEKHKTMRLKSKANQLYSQNKNLPQFYLTKFQMNRLYLHPQQKQNHLMIILKMMKKSHFIC